ncbi:MAG: globin domain-containing protein [Desulfovibrionaceae bacterium]
MNKETIDIIKQTVPALREHGTAITKVFYKNMLSEHPNLKNIFNMEKQENGIQPESLALTLLAAAENIENLENLMPAVKNIARKHVSLHVTKEQYDIVGAHLLRAIKETLGSAATDDIINAWATAYGVIATIFINLEEDMYKEMEKNGGWRGFKSAKVLTVKEDGANKIITLEVPAGHSIPASKEYLSIIYPFANAAFKQPRQYTISKEASSFTFILSKQDEESKKIFSSISTGDTIEVSYPV